MQAIFKTGGKQYKGSVGDTLKIEKLDAEVGSNISISDVLFLSEGDKISVGSPFVSGASVECEVVSNSRYKKVIIFKKKRRQKYRRKNGHRQHYTEVAIKSINGSV